MDLNKKQIEIFKNIEEGSKEAVAANESLGMSRAFAKLSEKVELVNLMLVPAMQSAGLVAGEVRDMYLGKGDNAVEIKIHLANVFQSVSVLSSLFEIPLSEIAEIAFKEKV